MSIKKCHIVLIFLMFVAIVTNAQERSTRIGVDFRVNITTIDSTYLDNKKELKRISDFLQSIKEDSTIGVKSVFFSGAASPEGSDQLNRRLARERMRTLEELVRREINIPDSIIHRYDGHISWRRLKEFVSNSDIQNKEEVLAILDEESELVSYYNTNSHIDSRIVKIQKLNNGKAWRQMHNLYFAQMRNANVEFVTYKKEIPPLALPLLPDKFTQTPVVDVPVAVEPSEIRGWDYRLHIKTNALGLSTGISNAAVEFDFAKHWSVAVPVYYSAWNYFLETIKFRTLAVQPEVRYWFSKDNDKFFLGAHFSYAQYNVAVDGNYRYQDKGGTSPALGGGISVGYRLPLERTKRWNVEFSLGAGVYPLKYDIFYNTEDTKNGIWAGSDKMTYWGLDNAAVTFSYAFDFKKRKK